MNTVMKRFVKFAAALLIINLLPFVFSSCGTQGSAERPEFSKPTFYLSELPELEPFEFPSEIKSRYGGETYVDKLMPAGDYGKLYPYEGKRSTADYWTSSKYGLVDAQGRIVVDPVYERAYYLGEGSSVLCLVYPNGGADATDYEFASRRMVIADVGGSWVNDECIGDWATMSEGRIIIHGYDTDQTGQYFPCFRIFDADGEPIAEGDGHADVFSEGLSAVYVVEKPVRQEQERAGHYQYIDKAGNVAIPGPFAEAYEFHDGVAVVADYEMAGTDETGGKAAPIYGVIDKKGEYIIPPEKTFDELRNFLNGESYYYFYESPDSSGFRGMVLTGIKDKDGKIVVPAEYRQINYSAAHDLAVAEHYIDGSFYVIDLRGGGKGKIESENGILSAPRLFGEWCVFDCGPETLDKAGSAGGNSVVFIKNGKEYRFDCSENQWLFCDWIRGDLFALTYSLQEQETPRDDSRVDIFDGDSGKIIKSFTGQRYLYSTESGLAVLDRQPNGGQMMVLNEDFEPHFPPETFGAGSGLTSFYPLADGIYQAGTVFSSGLLKENGEWLIRVNIDKPD